jgi:hypothetical protein
LHCGIPGVERDHVIALLDRRDARADIDDDTRALVAENDRKQPFRVRARARELVRVADPCRADLDEHFTGLGAVEVHGFDDERFSGLVADGGTSLHVIASRFRVDFRREAYRTRARLRIRTRLPVKSDVATLEPVGASKQHDYLDGQERDHVAIHGDCAGGVFGRALGAAENIDKVNGSIRIDGSRTVGDLSTVNGSIDVGEGTRAADSRR